MSSSRIIDEIIFYSYPDLIILMTLYIEAALFLSTYKNKMIAATADHLFIEGSSYASIIRSKY